MAKKKEEPIKALCANCNVVTNHKIVHEVSDDYDEGWWQQIKWQIIQCMGCEEISFRYDKVNEDDLNEDAGEYEHTVFLYPQRGLPINRYYYAPAPIRSMYEETLNSFNNGMFVLCGAGIRIVIERICSDKGIKKGTVPVLDENYNPVLDEFGDAKYRTGKDLECKISGLHEAKLLTEQHSKALHKLRFIGNSAVHSDTPKVQELKTGIKIVEHTLESLYAIKERAETIKDPKKKISTKNI